MKIEVNISKKYFITIIASLVLIAGVIGVVAYNPGGAANPALFGHSTNEIGIYSGIASTSYSSGATHSPNVNVNFPQTCSSGGIPRVFLMPIQDSVACQPSGSADLHVYVNSAIPVTSSGFAAFFSTSCAVSSSPGQQYSFFWLAVCPSS